MVLHFWYLISKWSKKYNWQNSSRSRHLSSRNCCILSLHNSQKKNYYCPQTGHYHSLLAMQGVRRRNDQAFSYLLWMKRLRGKRLLDFSDKLITLTWHKVCSSYSLHEFILGVTTCHVAIKINKNNKRLMIELIYHNIYTFMY